MMRVCRFLLACVFLPFAVAVAQAFVDVFRSVAGAELSSSSALAIFAGFLLHLILWIFVVKFVRAYVLGHELTHACVGLCFGSRVSNLKVGLRGGSVTLTKSNVLITLAPYFVPFYTVVVMLIALVVRLCVSPLPLPALWLFFVGFTWNFHLCFTLHSLCQRQPDIEEYGHLFSYVFIWITNVLGVLVAFVCTTEYPLRALLKVLLVRGSAAYLMVWKGCVWLYESVCSLPILQG